MIGQQTSQTVGEGGGYNCSIITWIGFYKLYNMCSQVSNISYQYYIVFVLDIIYI